jgi:hypothetical protein
LQRAAFAARKAADISSDQSRAAAGPSEPHNTSVTGRRILNTVSTKRYYKFTVPKKKPLELLHRIFLG